MKKFIERLRKLFLTPKVFFANETKYKKLKPVVILYFLLLLISTLFDLISFFVITFYVNKVQLSSGDLSQVIIGSLINFLIAFLTSFIWAFLLHSYLKLFKARGDFPVTYRIFVYSSAPSLLFDWVPVIGIIAALYGLYLLFVGTQLMHNLSKRTTVIAYLLLLGFIFLYILLRLIIT